MAIYRQAAKRDKSEPAIIKALETAGATVQRLSCADAPDLLVGWHGENFLIECKTGKAKPRTNQQEWANTWHGKPVIVAREPVDALLGIGIGGVEALLVLTKGDN